MLPSTQGKSPKLSILIPVYNVELYLAQCLDSIRHQDLSDVEIICLDDCSTDRSLDILHHYKATFLPHMQLIALSQNGGISNARNTLMALSKGEYIWFIDSDDWIEADAVKQLSAIFEREKCDMILFDLWRFRSKSKVKHVAGFTGSSNVLINSTHAILEGVFVSKKLYPWSRIFKKQVWLDEMSYPAGKCFEDVTVTPKLSSACKTAWYVSQPMYFYRDNEQSIVCTPNVAKLKNLSSALSGQLAFWQDINYQPSKRVLFAFYLFSVIKYLDACRTMKRNHLYTRSLNKIFFSDLLITTQSNKAQLMLTLIKNRRFKYALRLWRCSI